MAQSSVTPGLLDLEKELTCSICTDLLYQPLTCLDCLHTFCGSCLKEWFGWQKVRQSSTSRRRIEYTCPSCRAIVRETRPNATVTTLLDMYMAANPSRGKTSEEKAEIEKTYAAGDSVIPEATPTSHPTARRNRATSDASDVDEEEDERLLRQVRDMSLRDVGVTRPANASRENNLTSRSNPRTSTDRHHVTRPTMGESRGTDPTSAQRSHELDMRDHSDAFAGRRIEHQSSLRSLLSTSGDDSAEVQEEILRQIAEEGLLDGIDLNNIQAEQEDEISERIAQAYRRRHTERSSQRNTGHQEQRARDRSGHRHGNASSTIVAAAVRSPRSSSHRPHGRHASHDNTLLRPRDTDTSRAAARSATDLSERPRTREGQQERNRRHSQETRRSTDPDRNHISDRWRRGAAGISPQPPLIPVESPPAVESDSNALGLVTNTANVQLPSISCDQCGRRNIECDLHYSCNKCAAAPKATFDLCRRCYILGRGCHHWFGFGHAAWKRFEKQCPQGTELPHVLSPQQYVKRSESASASNGTVMSSLLTGVFCDNCLENANSCFWQCNVCNEGEWGFCNTCVNQARHCSHPLLALALDKNDVSQQQSLTDTTERQRAALLPLPTSASCNVCGLEIPASHSRYHCPTCNKGDYDICSSCYAGLLASGRVAPADGPNGWRRCLSGHRMLVIGFEPSRNNGSNQSFEWRHVVFSVIGGWASQDVTGQRPDVGFSWKDESCGTLRHQPGVTTGVRMTALWTRLPDEGTTDELSFPRGANVEEVVDINGDWCWGIYCRRGGLFPGAFARVANGQAS